MNKFNLNNQFVLGSASPRRLDLLNQIGINPDLVDAPNIDETNLKKELPLNYVKRMAIEKSLILQPKYKNSIIITADTVVALGRRILPKTTDVKMAEDCLRMISGRRHKVLTSFALYSPNKTIKVKTVVQTSKQEVLTEFAQYSVIERVARWPVARDYSLMDNDKFISAALRSYANLEEQFDPILIPKPTPA